MEECPSLAKPHGPTHLPRIVFWHVYDLQKAFQEGSENEGGMIVPGRLWDIKGGKQNNIHPENRQTTLRDTVPQGRPIGLD